MSLFEGQFCRATYRNRQVHLEEPVGWPEGTTLIITPVLPCDASNRIDGQVIVVGFGLAGRCVADLLDGAKIPYCVIERNRATVETQRSLGRNIVAGDATTGDVLAKAGLHSASILVLTIPDEAAVLEATSLVRRLRPTIYIIARTNYSSSGMKASQLGADDVVKAEQAVALQFYHKLSERILGHTPHNV